MRKDWIRKRQRKTQQISGIMRLANQASVSSLMNSVSNGECVSAEGGPSASFETTANQEHCYPSNYTSCDPMPVNTCEYKQVDYVQYYTPDYSSTVFQSQMGPGDESAFGQDLAHMAQPMAPCFTSVPSMSYLPSLHSYSAPVTDHYMQNLHVTQHSGAGKPHH